jgi:dolichol kinase
MAWLRKLAHLGGVLFVPVAIYSQYLALALALLGLALFVALERLKDSSLPGIAKLLYRDHELGGTALEPLAYLLSIVALLALSLVFSPPACYTAIIVMTAGDGIASVAGKAVRSPGLPGSRKTVAGTLSGFAAAAAAGYIVAGPPAIAGAAAGMIVEAYAGDIDNAPVAVAALLGTALAGAFV